MSARARIVTLLAMGLTALAGASAARAATGTVLTLNGHTVEVISGGRVHGYRYSRASMLQTGSRIRFVAARKRIRSAALAGSRSKRLAFAATVVSYGNSGLVLRLGDGALLRLAARRVERGCASALLHLRVGERLHVVELLGRGGYRLLLRAPNGGARCASSTGANGGPGGAPSASIQHANGVVTQIDSGDIVVGQTNGTSLTLTAPADAIDFLTSSSDLSLSTCETVSVSYEQQSAGFVLDSLAVTGQSSVGCVGGDGISLLVAGTLASAAAGSFTLDVAGEGVLTLTQDPSNRVTDGLVTGDQVLVAYTVGLGGALLATDAADDIQYATGTVTAVDAGGAEVLDRTTGHSRRYLADGAGFQTAGTGDQVAVAYYSSAAGLEAENVDDLTNGTTG